MLKRIKMNERKNKMKFGRWFAKVIGRLLTVTAHKIAITSLAIIMVTVGFGVPSSVLAVDQPIDHYEVSNSTFWSYRNVYTSSSMGYMGAEWSSARNCWCLTFRYIGTGATRWVSGGSPANLILGTSMEINGVSNPEHMALWTSLDNRYIGSAPESSGSQPDYEDIASAIAGLAITGMNNFGISFLWSAATFIDALYSTVDSTATQEDYLWRYWSWSNAIADTGQFFWFLVDVDPYQIVQFSHDYMIYGLGFEMLQADTVIWTIDTGAGENRSIEQGWSPALMSAQEKIDFGIEEIPLEKIEKRGEELGISPESIKEFYASGEKVFYFAHNLVVFPST